MTVPLNALNVNSQITHHPSKYNGQMTFIVILKWNGLVVFGYLLDWGETEIWK